MSSIWYFVYKQLFGLTIDENVVISEEIPSTWLTYQNGSLFTFKYPSDWYIENPSGDPNLMEGQNVHDSLFIIPLPAKDNEYTTLTFEECVNQYYESCEERMDIDVKVSEYTKDVVAQTISVNGYEGYSVSGQTDILHNGMFTPVKETRTKIGDDILTLNSSGTPAVSMHDKILSSFSFSSPQ